MAVFKGVIQLSGNKERIEEYIEITNMTCKGCARTLENELRKFKDIDYEVSFPERSIKISYSLADYSLEEFVAAIESHGYKIKGKAY
jgi:copper chaperone CopZ